MRVTQGHSPLLWLNLVCLDAPLVAVSWQQLFARGRFVEDLGAARLALFATAWLIYLADRLGDALSLAPRAPVSLRQRFAQRHRRLFFGAIVFAAALDAVAIAQLDRSRLLVGATLGAASILYLVVNHFVSRVWRVLPIKEVIVGCLFAAGVRGSFGGTAVPHFGLVLLFAALCTLNCVSIAFWERDLDLAQRRSSIATAFPTLQQLPIFVCVALAIGATGLLFDSLPRVALLCIAASSALLALLNSRYIGLKRDARTALADLVLLTPLVFIGVSSV